MVQGPSAIGSHPSIQFRPDPGEPAVRLSAKPQDTAALVTAQEQRNETRLRNRALAHGEDILYSNRTFTTSLGNSSPVYNGGLTTVVTRKDSNGFLPDTQVELNPSSRSVQAQENEENNEKTPSAEINEPQKNQESKTSSEEELEQTEQKLENEDARLERNLTRARMEQMQAQQNENPAQMEQAQRKAKEIEQEKEEIQKEKREVEQEKMQAKLEEFLQQTSSFLEDNSKIASGMLDAMFGLKRPSNSPSGSSSNFDVDPPSLLDTSFARNRVL